MRRLTRLFTILHTVLFIVSGVSVWYILNHFFPHLLVHGYFVIPVFFYLLGLFFIYKFKHASLEKPKEMVNTYMLLRMIKIFASFVIIFVYWIIHKPNIRNFAIVFVIFYLIYLLWETFIFTKMENYIKYKIDQKKPPLERIDTDE